MYHQATIVLAQVIRFERTEGPEVLGLLDVSRAQ